MPHHPTFLRLVSDKSSSSDKSTPRSRAKRSKGKRQRCGTPLPGQLRTAEPDSPNSTASASAPPNRAINSPTLSMNKHISHIGTYCNPKVRFSAKPVGRGESSTRTKCPVTIWDMAKSKKKYADFGSRLRAAREALFDGNAKEFAEQIGLKDQTYRNYERGDRLPDDVTIRIIAEEGISLTWLFLNERPMLDPIRIAQVKRLDTKTG